MDSSIAKKEGILVDAMRRVRERRQKEQNIIVKKENYVDNFVIRNSVLIYDHYYDLISNKGCEDPGVEVIWCSELLISSIKYYQLSKEILDFMFGGSMKTNCELSEKIGLVTLKDEKIIPTEKGIKICEEYERISDPDFSLEKYLEKTTEIYSNTINYNSPIKTADLLLMDEDENYQNLYQELM